MGMSSFLDIKSFPLLPKREYIRQVLSLFHYIAHRYILIFKCTRDLNASMQ
jgi:hypothetical protein